MGACYKCSEPFLDDGELAADAVCKKCSSWLHCCANCLHYDEYAHNKCREPKAEFIFDRLGKNECKFFKFRRLIKPDREKERKSSPRAEQRDREGKAREGLERLFNK